jgi:DnaK suppressor protein
MLPEQKVQMYREKLEAERERLMKQISGKGEPRPFGSDIDDGEEEGDEAEEFANQVAANAAIKDRVNEIDAALNRMEMGSYGLCEQCNKIIGDKLLAVVPETRLCEDCKRK